MAHLFFSVAKLIVRRCRSAAVKGIAPSLGLAIAAPACFVTSRVVTIAAYSFVTSRAVTIAGCAWVGLPP